MKTLYILRGVSGSGKTTLAKTLEESLPKCIAFAADDYFYEKGEYRFVKHKLQEAHDWCQRQVHMYMNLFKCENLIVHNTNTSEKEIAPYITMAEEYGYKVVSLIDNLPTKI